jgi:hypothetical protein
MTDQELKDLVASLAVSQTETDRKLKSIGIQLGNIGENNGMTTEQYFYNTLFDTMKFGDIKYDEIEKNIKIKSKRAQDEYDIVMYNGNSIALIECKYKAHEKDVKKLIEKKVDSFRMFFPDYKDYKIYLGIASFSFYDELENYAKENGVAVLKQKGGIMQIDDSNLKIY